MKIETKFNVGDIVATKTKGLKLSSGQFVGPKISKIDKIAITSDSILYVLDENGHSMVCNENDLFLIKGVKLTENGYEETNE